jgi:MFS family permease
MYIYFLLPFLMDTSMGIILVALPLLLAYRFNAGSMIVGLVAATCSLIYIVSSSIFGRLSDKWGYKATAAAGSAVTAIGYSLLACAGNLTAVLIFASIGTIGNTMFWPALQAWFSHGKSKRDIITALGLFNIGWSFGLGITGALAGGYLFGMNYGIPFITGGIGCILTTGIVLSLNDRLPEKKTSHQKLPAEEPPPNWQNYLFTAWVANFVSFFVMATVRNFFPLLGIQTKLTPGWIGFLIFFMGVSQTLMFAILKNSHKWHYRLWPIIQCQILAVAGLIIAAVATNAFLFAIAFLMVGGMAGLSNFSSNFYSVFGTASKGARCGIHEAVLASGGLAAAISGGILGQTLNLRVPFIACAGLTLSGMVIEYALISSHNTGKKQKS